MQLRTPVWTWQLTPGLGVHLCPAGRSQAPYKEASKGEARREVAGGARCLLGALARSLWEHRTGPACSSVFPRGGVEASGSSCRACPVTSNKYHVSRTGGDSASPSKQLEKSAQRPLPIDSLD